MNVDDRSKKLDVLNFFGLHNVILNRDEHFITFAQEFALRLNRTKSPLRRAGGEVIFFMIKWAVIFLVIALVAGVLSFAGVAGAAASIAKFLFFLFVGICVVLFIFGIVLGKKLTK